MRAALTGATGFVGSHLAEALRRRGDEVACLARSAATGAWLETLGCRLVTGDLDDVDALKDLVDGAAVVYHAAGVIAASGEAEFFRCNADGTQRVARAARASGALRLLYVSSLAVSGPTVSGRPLDEASGPGPITPYGRSKRAGEEAVRASGLAFTIVRPPAVYGPRDRQFLRLFRAARRGLAPLLGDGGQELSLVHAADLAQAAIAAATSGATAGRVYHAAHAEVVTQRAFVQSIGRSLGVHVRMVPLPARLARAVLHVTGAAARLAGTRTILDPSKAGELLAPAWTCSSEALARDTGWRARIPLEAGLADTARWYREAGWL